MGKKIIPEPTVTVLDEWVKEIDGYEFVFQIKRTSGGNHPTWYPVSFWRNGYPLSSVRNSFDDRPNRIQVEEQFASSVQSFIKTYIKQ
ncbi:MAG TPA: hypothetical protein VJ866_13215 [Pyrinomonadaceae bacterium]|nr:hypothetical protein [Pyrinomonadaceae bacterium]